MSVLIFANGEINSSDWLSPHFAEADVIIAADGGAIHILDLGHIPDVVIGDLDSITEESKRQLYSAGSTFIAHQVDKDETDLELALMYAVDNFSADILIFGFLGGRLDQTLGNIMLLAHPLIQQRSVTLLDEYQSAQLVDSTIQIQGSVGDTISLVPFGGHVHIVYTSGLKWALIDEVLSFGPARGISNELTAEKAVVTIGSGSLLCIHTSQEWGR